jgi:alpha-1,2-mannosyltransferase
MAGEGRSGRLCRFLLTWLPVAMLTSAVVSNLRRADGLPDFRIYRLAGAAVLHGHSPYVSPSSVHSVGTAGFVYPAPAAWAMAPFALLRFDVAAVIFVVIATAAVVGTLWLLEVRETRCYGVALALMPVSTAITTGTVSTLLTCAAALVWRYRDRVLWPALGLAAALMLKPLLWPIVAWLAATRRWRAAALSSATALVGTMLGYAALHIDGLRSYPAIVKAATLGEGDDSFSVYGIFVRLGVPAPQASAELVGAAVLVGVWLLARRNERLSFVAAIVATLVLTPILWLNSFSLLLIPLALASRRLTWWWTVPWLLWFVDPRAFDASLAGIGLVWLAAAVTLGALRPSRARSEPLRARTLQRVMVHS